MINKIEVYNKKNLFNSRQWILENATYEIWVKQWKDFIKENYNYEIK